MHAIERDIREFVVDNFLFGDGDDLTNTDSFLESGIIDSIGVLELVGFLESRYLLQVEDHEFVPANLDSVDRVVRFVTDKLQANGKAVAG
jgi:acyl carrier protein